MVDYTSLSSHFERVSRESSLGGAGQPDISYGHTILGVAVSMTVLALISVVLRLYVRSVMMKSVGWDDIVMVIAMTFELVFFGLLVRQVHYGAGRHTVYIMAENPDYVAKGLKLNFITQPIVVTCITIIKTSVGLFLLRIAANKRYRIFILGMICFMWLYTFVGIITICFQCNPLASIWDSSIPAVCWPRRTLLVLSYTNQSLVILSDFVFSIMPAIMLRNIQVNWRVKIALYGVTSLGIFAAIASLVKVPLIADYGKTGDFLFDSRGLSIWTMVEATVGIIAGSIPSLKPLFKVILGGSSYGADYVSGGRRYNKGYAVQSPTSGTIKEGGKRSLHASLHGNVATTEDNQQYELYARKDIGTGVHITSLGNRRVLNSLTDNTSEESILAAESRGTGIMKTTRVEVHSVQVHSDDEWRRAKEIV